MRRFKYEEPDSFGNNVVITVNEEYLRLTYPAWKKRVQEAHPFVFPRFEEYVWNFTTINGAWEI